MVRMLKESNQYPAGWTADTDIHQVFSTLDQSDTKNPGSIEDLYGFDMYNVGWVDGDEDIIKIYAESGNSSETFYVFPNYTNNTYRIDTEELGERTVGKATDVWDIMSTCLTKQLKDTSSALVYEESITEDFDDDYDDDDDEDIVASYNVSYEDEDGGVYDDGGQFHIYFNSETGKYSWSSDALDMSSDETFDTEEEAYDDAEYAHQASDGSRLVIY